MDNQKNFFRALFWALLVFLAWQLIASRIWPAPSPTAAPAPTPATADAATTEPAATPAAPSPGVAAAPDSPPPDGDYHVLAAEPESAVLGSTNGFKDSPFRVQLEFSNRGASLDTVRLSDHRKSVDTEKRYKLLAPIHQTGDVWRSLTVEQVNIDDRDSIELGDVPWAARAFDHADGPAVEFTATIARGPTPVLEIARTFVLPPQPHTARRHDLRLTTTVRNLSDAPHTVILREHGPVGIASEGNFQPDQKVFCATRGAGYVNFAAKTFKDVDKKGSFRFFPFAGDADQPLLWYGAGNLYFTATACPVAADGRDAPGGLAQVEGVDLDGNTATEGDVTLRVTYSPIRLEPRQAHTLHAALYIGPKDRKAFENNGNADYVAREYMLQIKDGYGSCTFNFLTDLMIRLLNWLESVFHNFGVAVIFLVVIVRVLLHPITRKTQINMVKMQKSMGALQPKLEAVKKKYAGDNARMQQELMKVYREEGTSPFGQMMSCLPMFLQMPIWIALYSSLRNNVAMRGRGFIWWIEDLTAPDCAIHFSKPLDLPLLGQLECFHLLPILVGVMMFAQQKLMPKPAAPSTATKSPQAQQAEQMQKMMPYMSLIMIVLFYKFPSGLNLYIMASSLIGTLEQIYIRRHIKQRDLEAPAPAKPKKPLPGMGFFEKLQKQAEEAQKIRSQRDRAKRH